MSNAKENPNTVIKVSNDTTPDNDVKEAIIPIPGALKRKC